MNRDIEVWADWQELGGATRMGLLHAQSIRGKQIFSFEYEHEWLTEDFFRAIDPDLQLYPGPQYIDADHRSNFGLFLDSSPDRWGRLLMQRREVARARAQQHPVKPLQEIDYLLGVHDEQRVGALRFKETGQPDDAWLSNDPSMITPPWTSLRELQQACWNVQRDRADEDPQYLNWLKQILAPGSSLGGARPKAGVCDPQGSLWIAKFPARNDTRDIGAWEMVAHELALAAGLSMSEAQLEQFGDQHHTYMTRRFDRIQGPSGTQRIHFASAMTLLGYRDGADHSSGASYLDLVDLLIRIGANPTDDLPELWRRIVFSIAIRNTDDHLRNHGFLLTPTGWRLSPAYDLNPTPDGQGLHLNISEHDNELRFELAREVAPYFRLSSASTRQILDEVDDALSTWRQIAKRLGISRAEQDVMEPAFQRPQA